MNPTDWLTLALVGITGWYAWLTRRMLIANEAMLDAVRKQQHATMRPYVQISTSVRTGTNLIYLEILNVGKTAANDLTLALDTDIYPLEQVGEHSNLRNTSAFSRTIRSFPPDSKLRFLLGTGPSILTGKQGACPREFNVSATYLAGHERVVEVSPIDLNPYLHTEVPQDPVVDELRKLREKLTGLERIR